MLGEAATQVSPEIRKQYPTVAWIAATRLRNRIVHGYWSIDMGLLIDTAADDLPLMIDQITAVLDDLE